MKWNKEEWGKEELGSVCEVIAGQSPKSEYYNKDGQGTPFFQGKADFGDRNPTVRYWTSKITKLSKPKDILFSVRAPVGPININNIEACIGRGLAAVRPSPNVDLEFLKSFFHYFEPFISKLGTGSTFKAITVGTLKSLQIPLPPLAVQKEIADLLDTADALRQKTQAQLTALDDLAQSVFLEMFGDPVTNEKGWEVRKLGQLSKKVQIGPFGSQLHRSDYCSLGYSLVNPTDIKNNKIDVSNCKLISEDKFRELPTYHLAIGDIVMARRGDLSKIAVVDVENLFCGTGSLYIRFSSEVDTTFILSVLSHRSSIKTLYDKARGVTMANINKTIITSFSITE